MHTSSVYDIGIAGIVGNAEYSQVKTRASTATYVLEKCICTCVLAVN